MAVAARNKYGYAPSRVYSYSRTATAEALPGEAPRPEEREAARPVPAAPQRNAPKTRVNKGLSTKAQRRRATVAMAASVAGVFMVAAMLIAIILRYAGIAAANAEVNSVAYDIRESERRIAALEVELNSVMSLDEAKRAAHDAGMGYPTAEQIVTVNGVVGGYIDPDAGTTPDKAPQEPAEPGEPQ